MMDRRAFITMVGESIFAAPLAAEAQPTGKIPRIGLLADAESWEPLRQGLHDLGYVEGKTVTFERRSSAGRGERLPDLAAELVRLNVDIIVTIGTPATFAAKRATTAIPVVMAYTGDPLSSGLIASLARPGGNITGLTAYGGELATKRLEIEPTRHEHDTALEELLLESVPEAHV